MRKEDRWDYYDRSSRSYIYLECRLHQKHYTPSLLQVEEGDKFQSGMGTETYETPDLQLTDSNGIWFTNSSDPEYFQWPINDEHRTCSLCDIVCDIRDDMRYMREDGSCPYDDADAPPEPLYRKIQDYDQPCRDFLHPLLLQDIPAINRRRRRMTKAKLWSYLKQKRWRDALINKGERIKDVWLRNYQPVTVYFNSFESVRLYIKNLPAEMRNNRFLRQRIRENLELSPSYRECLERGEWEERMLSKINSI